MEDVYKDNVALPVASSQTDVCSSEVGAGKLADDVNTIIPADSWDASGQGLSKGGLAPLVEATAGPPVGGNPATETPGGMSLKVATTVLQPICLGESPMMLPIHLQMAGAAAPQVGQMGAAPFFMTSQGPISLPLVLEQQLFQHLSPPSMIPQAGPCAALALQNNILCQNASLTFGPAPPAAEQKPGQSQDPGLLALLQNPAFAAILQDLFPIPGNSPSPGSVPTDPFASAFLPPPPPPPPPPPLPHPYSSPLAPLVPPATLLVPYPVVVPLPVPLPLPLPLPIPVPLQTEDSKGNLPKARACTVSKSTQTYSTSSSSPPPSPGGLGTPPRPRRRLTPSSPTPAEGEALDLSLKACPIEPKQEAPPSPQENVLDLSVGGARRTCSVQSHGSNAPPGGERERQCVSGQRAQSGGLSLGILRPVECTQRLDSKLLSGLASLEFSRQHKWVMDSGGGGGGAGALGREASLGATGNLEIVSTSQTAKVIVSVKDAIPAILCGKIKGLSGVSTKNFSIKRDGAQGASLQQLYGASSRAPGEQRDPNDPLKKVPKNRAIKLKKVSSQEIHILPIKKQRLAAFLPRK